MRVVKVKESGNETVSYTYDKNGNKKSETLANGVVSTYTYNKANRITKIENKSGNTDISSYEYSYYLDGSDACKIHNESGIIETTSYEYDGLTRLTEEAVKVGNNTTDTYAYEYDDYGNRSKMTAAGTEDFVTEYSYVDSNGKYTALLQKEVKTVENEADENLITLNPASDVKQTVYTYDSNGNQIKKTANGKTETNTYDGLNQLIGFTDGETTASYAYNVDGLRYEKTVNGQTINHVWDGSKQIVADIIDGQFYEADCYIRGTNLVAKYNYRNGNKSEYTYYTQNAHGDVVNLTDSAGAVTKKYTYDAFGVEKNIDDSDTNAFRYCGEYYDAETGTIYLRARYYNPINGRFTSRDTALGNPADPLSLNLYTYCHNNPVLGVDPSGHFFETLLDVVGLVVDVVDFVKEPSVGGFVDIAWDIGGLLVPGVPGSYAGDAVEAVYDVTKAVDKAHDVKKAANAADAAGDLGKAAKKLDTASDAYKDIDRSTEVLQQGKKVPNQYGKKGCSEHRAEIDKAVDDMQKRGLDTATEYKFDTYGGYKNSRYADAVGIKDGKIVEIHQVGVSTKRGLPVSRERKAISDIENSTGINVTFHSYKRR